MKRDFRTVKVFSHPSEVPVVQSFMEMRGIECYMKNYIFNSLAYNLGDIEMQVKTEDYDMAVEALIEGGFLNNNDISLND